MAPTVSCAAAAYASATTSRAGERSFGTVAPGEGTVIGDGTGAGVTRLLGGETRAQRGGLGVGVPPKEPRESNVRLLPAPRPGTEYKSATPLGDTIEPLLLNDPGRDICRGCPKVKDCRASVVGLSASMVMGDSAPPTNSPALLLLVCFTKELKVPWGSVAPECRRHVSARVMTPLYVRVRLRSCGGSETTDAPLLSEGTHRTHTHKQ